MGRRGGWGRGRRGPPGAVVGGLPWAVVALPFRVCEPMWAFEGRGALADAVGALEQSRTATRNALLAVIYGAHKYSGKPAIVGATALGRCGHIPITRN